MLRNIIILIIIIGVAVGGYFYYQSTQSTEKKEETEITITPKVDAKPTEEPVKKDAYKIEILNGSGIAGKASEAEELLKDNEFNVVSTGNADTYDYEKTVILVGEDVADAWVDELKETLGNNYSVESSVDERDSNANVDADVTVIIGKLDDSGKDMTPEEEEPAPTSTPAEEEADEATPTPSKSPSPSPSPTGT